MVPCLIRQTVGSKSVTVKGSRCGYRRFKGLLKNKWILSYALFGFLVFTLHHPHHNTICTIEDGTSAKAMTNGQCLPKRNVMYLKVPKTASSTIQNILLRYAESRNLTVMLPRTGISLGYPKPFRLRYAMPLPSLYSDTYNIVTHHVSWHDSIPSLMPVDTIFIASIREPVAEFTSAYTALDWQELRYGVDLETFMQNPQYYLNRSRIFAQARNPMMENFGLSRASFEDERSIRKKIRKISKQFDFILLADHLTESLVILRELLCWTWNDIVAFSVNARIPALRRKPISSRKRNAILKWNHADVLLYEYFSRQFMGKKIAYGLARLKKDELYLRNLTNQWYSFCVKRPKYGMEDVPHAQVWRFKGAVLPVVRKWEMGFALNKQNETCQKMAMHGLFYTERLRVKMWATY